MHARHQPALKISALAPQDQLKVFLTTEPRCLMGLFVGRTTACAANEILIKDLAGMLGGGSIRRCVSEGYFMPLPMWIRPRSRLSPQGTPLIGFFRRLAGM